jgi:hypothetical protein
MQLDHAGNVISFEDTTDSRDVQHDTTSVAPVRYDGPSPVDPQSNLFKETQAPLDKYTRDLAHLDAESKAVVSHHPVTGLPVFKHDQATRARFSKAADLMRANANDQRQLAENRMRDRHAKEQVTAENLKETDALRARIEQRANEIATERQAQAVADLMLKRGVLK